jgi:hypothetical protein
MLTFLSQRTSDLYDRLDSSACHQWLERSVVVLATSGLLIHLSLIFLARTIPQPEGGWLSEVGRNYLHAIYTPFSFILFYEVLLLVLALPKSLTSSIGKQYQIISLIIVRRVFKDIGSFSDVDSWLAQTDTLWLILVDMLGALLMFLTVAAFYRIRTKVVKTDTERDLENFIRIKKAIAILLGIVLIGLAFYNLLIWVLTSLSAPIPYLVGPEDIDGFFFPAFFEFMIFTDVFLLILSILYYERYEYVFRNAGFVISTVLLRISLSTKQPYDLGIGLVAMVYGLGVIAVFAYYTENVAAQHDENRELPPNSRRPNRSASPAG